MNTIKLHVTLSDNTKYQYLIPFKHNFMDKHLESYIKKSPEFISTTIGTYHYSKKSDGYIRVTDFELEYNTY